MDAEGLSGDELVQVLAALSNPHRVRVLAVLAGGRSYVSQLARELGISRALLQVHLKKLEKAGLVTAHMELIEGDRAVKYYETTPFSLHLTPDLLASAAETLTSTAPDVAPPKEGNL